MCQFFKASESLLNQFIRVCTKQQLLWKPEKIGTQINVLLNSTMLMTDIQSGKPDI